MLFVCFTGPRCWAGCTGKCCRPSFRPVSQRDEQTTHSKAVGSADRYRKSATESTGSHTWPSTHLPIRYILHDLLFSGERSGVPSVGISILFGEDEGDEVDPRPSRLSLEFSVSGQATWERSATEDWRRCRYSFFRCLPNATDGHSPPLQVALPNQVESVCADGRDTSKDGSPTGSSDGQASLVSDRLEASRRRHVPT
jgi:hypothetical protein